MNRRSRRSSRRRIFTVVGGFMLAFGAVVALLAAVRLAGASSDLRTASDLVDDAGVALEEGRLADAQEGLRQAGDLLTDATNALYGHPELEVIGFLPVGSSNLDQLRESVGVAATLVSGGERILRAAEPLQSSDGTLETSMRKGGISLDAVRTVGREAALLATALPAADASPRSLLVGPVEELRSVVAAEAAQRKAQLRGLASGLELLADMAGANGDRRYLIAVANTAEMRGSGGMVLSYGVLVGKDGQFDLEDFGRIDELRLPGPIPRDSVPQVPEDYLDRWEGFQPLELWRNATLSGDFELTAPVLETMYGYARDVKAAGVIQVDPQGLAALLQGVGPVDVPPFGAVTSENVVDLVLNQAYLQFPDTDERSDLLGDVAEAAFRKLVDGEYDSLRPLGDALLGAVDGRHLMMHTVAAGPQRQLHYVGADGALPPVDGPDALNLTVQNVSANKLDYYVDTALAVSGTRPAGDIGAVQATITVTNTAPAGVRVPRYVFGPFNEDQEAGLYRGEVSLYLPAGTSLAGAAGDPLPSAPVLRTEGGRPVVGFHLDVPAGEARRVVLDLKMAPRPPGGYELLVVPAPRVRPTSFTVDLDAGQTASGQVRLDRAWWFRSGQPPEPYAPPSGPRSEGSGG